MKKRIFFLCIIILLLVTLTGCLPGSEKFTSEKTAGFLWGIWHGWIAPISLVVGLFKKNIRIYEIYNTGWWYDLGFYIAIISGFGSLSLSRKKGSKKNDKR